MQERALREMINDRETNGLKPIVRRIGNGRGLWRFDMEALAQWETPGNEQNVSDLPHPYLKSE